MFKKYLALTKPGIIMGNAITATGGFVLASKYYFDGFLFIAMFFGLSCVIASGCILNNYIDREADKKMERTKNRPFATGAVSDQNAVVFALALLIAGLGILALYTNFLTLLIALSGFFVYVFVYSFLKYRTSWATVIGSVAGAAPPVIGYCSVTNKWDMAATLLFLIVAFWQMPHFYAIAIFRKEDYSKANIPVLPVEKNNQITKIHMFFYVLAFLIVAILPTVYGYASTIYLTSALIVGGSWLFLSIKGFKKDCEDKIWAKKMFMVSLIVITLLCTALSIESMMSESNIDRSLAKAECIK